VPAQRTTRGVAAALLAASLGSSAASARPPASPATVVYRCQGFAAPLDKQGSQPLRIKRGRTLPLKAVLLDKDGKALDASAVKTPPKVQILFRPASGPEADRTRAIEAGDFGKGRSFVYRESYWKFDLQSDALPETGTYRVRVLSGDEAAYRVDPSCELLVTVE
jgi:hypothetical protein